LDFHSNQPLKRSKGMSTITKLIWFFSIIIWFISLGLLIIALTDLMPNSSLKEYRFFIGMLFITISGFIRHALQKLGKQEQSFQKKTI